MNTWGAFCLGFFLTTSGAAAQADYEFFTPSCPVKDSFPGYNFKTISALGVAVLANASEDIGTFLEIGCDPNFNETSLSYIETECKNPIFIKLGIPCAREVTIEGYTPLILAVSFGTSKSVKKLSKLPQTDLDAQTSNSLSPLWLAASYGNLEYVQVLSEAGANLDLVGGEYLTTPLGAAVLLEDVDMVKYLIKKGANVNRRSKSNSSPANYAVTKGNLKILKMLKAGGVNLDGEGEGEDDAPLLVLAAASNQKDILNYLISQKVNLNMKDGKGRNALSFASFSGNLDIVKSLARAGADLDILYGTQKLSALSTALLEGNTDIALFLIQSGADVNTQTIDGFTAAFIAAQEGNLVAMKALVEAETDLETKGGPFQMTPLTFAAFKGHLDIVKYLSAKGADLGAEDKEGKTALNLAREAGHDDVVEFLEEK